MCGIVQLPSEDNFSWSELWWDALVFELCVKKHNHMDDHMFNDNHREDWDVNIDAVAMFFDMLDFALNYGHMFVLGANVDNNFVQ